MKKYKVLKDFPVYDPQVFRQLNFKAGDDIKDTTLVEGFVAQLLEHGFIEGIKENPVDDLFMNVILHGCHEYVRVDKSSPDYKTIVAKAKQSLCKAQIDHLLRYGFGDGKHQNMYKHIRGFWGVEEEE
jgi:hypothetical protein